MPRNNRLKNRLDFREILARGTYVKGKFFAIKYIRIDSPETKPLIGFIVSKKFSKCATDRNFLKRRLRAIMAEFLGRLVGGLKLVVIASRPQTDVKFNDLRDDLTDLLSRADLYGN